MRIVVRVHQLFDYHWDQAARKSKPVIHYTYQLPKPTDSTFIQLHCHIEYRNHAALNLTRNRLKNLEMCVSEMHVFLKLNNNILRLKILLFSFRKKT